MSTLVALSRFDAELSWLDRKTRIVDVTAGGPLPRLGSGQVVVGDSLVVLERVPAEADHGGMGLLLLDSVGPAELPAEAVARIRRHPRLRLLHAVRHHRQGYLERGLPESCLVFTPAALTFFPLILPDFVRPAARWSPPPRPRLFSGGRVWRDFETLRAASQRLEVPVVVITDQARVQLRPGPYLRPFDLQPFAAFCRGLCECSCTILPLEPNDRNAGQATVALAAFVGAPVVATDSRTLREYVRHGETGLLVPPRDPAALASAVQRFLQEPALARACGEAARQVSATWEAESRAATLAALADLEAAS